MPRYKKLSTEMEAVEFTGEEIPGCTMVFDRDDEGAKTCAVYNQLHDSWIKLKVGDFVRTDLAPTDVYPIDRAYFLANFVPVKNGDTGAERIAAERNRQIEEEGWSAEHDSIHENDELSLAAICYASPIPVYCKIWHVDGTTNLEDPFPWAEWDKRHKHNRIRQLEIAGALIAAEIDRLTAPAKG